MCGIVGILAQSAVQQDAFDALTVLQHRGQDAAGMITTDGDHFYLRKANGLVRDVFHQRHMNRLHGNAGIGHVRYPTAGSSSEAEAQPFYINAPFGIALAHNGNLTNYASLREQIVNKYHRHINTESDSEILLNVLAHHLEPAGEATPDAVFAAVKKTMETVTGGYAAVALIAGIGLLAFRDPHGIRPLMIGKRGKDYMIASESVALDTLGFERIGDIGPGEAVLVDFKHQVHRKDCLPETLTPCAFEFVYLARPDSIIDGISVHQARLNMGKYLAQQILHAWPDHDIDVVLPIPDTSRTSALPIAEMLGVPMRDGFVKNRYIGRTFIMPEQHVRKKSVRKKLNPIEVEFKGKNVLLVDDSIVRGTTCKQIIQMARDAGAKKVYFASAAPPVRYPNVYGIDMPVRQELIAYNKDIGQICKLIGADKLFYQTVEDLIKALNEANPQLSDFEASVFNGKYIVGGIDENYMQLLEAARSDAAKSKRNGNSSSVIDLSNAVI
jgi:amidophosphoribosyltransferase